MTQRLHVLLVLAVVAAAGVASAQPGDPPAQPTAAPTEPPAQPAAAPANGKPPPYKSPHRQMCGEELRKDADWLANVERVFEVEAHEKAAAKIRTNERHVFIAYGVIWVLVAGFVGVMWMRQGKLKGEIKRLEEELRRAEAEDEALATQSKGKPAARGKGADDGAGA